jgi:phosphoribosyl 1,2-cyclic phosphate phosphodiesterase
MSSSTLTITVLGSGTSAGVPMIGCHCAVCQSADPRDKRTRPSVAVSYGGKHILVDTTPELRLQAVANGLHHIDAVVFTHGHADHIFGLDDIRRYNTVLHAALPVHAAPETLAILHRCFPYAFDKQEDIGVYRPQIVPHEIRGPFDLFGQIWTPIPMVHGRAHVLGFRIGNFAYCTDCNEIPEASQQLLEGLDLLIIDALRPRPHPTHLSFEQALAMIDRLRPHRAFFTHLAHDVSHVEIESTLPAHVRVLYDGLRIHVDP